MAIAKQGIVAMKIARPVAVVVSLFFLASCVTSTEKLEKSSSTLTAERTYSENYQEIYRRVSGEAKRCMAVNMLLYSSMEVDAELYTELGFGEVTWSLINIGVRNYFMKVKIEKMGTGSKLTIASGNTLNKQGVINRVLLWAGGGKDC